MPDRNFIRYRLPLLALLAIHFTLSSIPGTSFPQTGKWDFTPLAHVAIFALIGLLALRDQVRGKLRAPGLMLLLLVFVSGFIWGLSDETYQEYFVETRHWDNWDLLMDAIGLAIGLIFYRIIHARAMRNATSIFTKLI